MSMLCDVSPDGAFVCYAQSRNGRREADIWRANITTGGASIVLPGRGRMLDCEAVSTDGRHLKDSDRFRLWQFRTSDKAPVRVPSPLNNDLESLSLRTDGRIAVAGYRTELTSRTAIHIDGGCSSPRTSFTRLS